MAKKYSLRKTIQQMILQQQERRMPRLSRGEGHYSSNGLPFSRRPESRPLTLLTKHSFPSKDKPIPSRLVNSDRRMVSFRGEML